MIEELDVGCRLVVLGSGMHDPALPCDCVPRPALRSIDWAVWAGGAGSSRAWLWSIGTGWKSLAERCEGVEACAWHSKDSSSATTLCRSYDEKMTT